MKRARELSAAVVCGLTLLTVLYGCSGGGDDGEETASTTQTQTTATNVINRVLAILFGDDTGVRGQTRGRPSQGEATLRQTSETVTIACSTGQATFTGEVTEDGESVTLDGTITFANCDGINGGVTLDAEATIAGSQIPVTVTLNGSVTAEGCTVTFNAFSVSTTASQSGVITSPIVANGTVSATCDGDSVTCTLNNVDLSNQAAFENSCRSI